MSVATKQSIKRLEELRNDLLGKDQIWKKLRNQEIYSTQDLQAIVKLTKDQNLEEPFVKMYKVNRIASFMQDQLSIRRRKAYQSNYSGLDDVIKEQRQKSSEKVKLKEEEETSPFEKAWQTIKGWVI